MARLREINLTPTLNRRRYACMARLRSNFSNSFVVKNKQGEMYKMC